MPSSRVIIASVVTLIGLVVALTLGLALTHNLDNSSTPLVTAILALVVTTIPALLALASAERAANAAEGAHAVAKQTLSDLNNGVLKAKVREALNESVIPTPTQTDPEMEIPHG